MFYSHFILAKKGPLGTIWIAAHLERKLRKNQVADTNIGNSVDSILSSDVPIALRLSSHLLLGVVKIYSRKVNYLFDDCSEALLKVKRAFRSTTVDLPPEEAKAPYHFITLPETFDLDDFELPEGDLFQGNYVDRHVSAREQITLQDTMDGVVYSTTRFGLDERFTDGDTELYGLDIEDMLESGKEIDRHVTGMDTYGLESVRPTTPVKADEINKGMSDTSDAMTDNADKKQGFCEATRSIESVDPPYNSLLQGRKLLNPLETIHSCHPSVTEDHNLGEWPPMVETVQNKFRNLSLQDGHRSGNCPVDTEIVFETSLAFGRNSSHGMESTQQLHITTLKKLSGDSYLSGLPKQQKPGSIESESALSGRRDDMQVEIAATNYLSACASSQVHAKGEMIGSGMDKVYDDPISDSFSSKPGSSLETIHAKSTKDNACNKVLCGTLETQRASVMGSECCCVDKLSHVHTPCTVQSSIISGNNREQGGWYLPTLHKDGPISDSGVNSASIVRKMSDGAIMDANTDILNDSRLVNANKCPDSAVPRAVNLLPGHMSTGDCNELDDHNYIIQSDTRLKMLDKSALSDFPVSEKLLSVPEGPICTPNSFIRECTSNKEMQAEITNYQQHISGKIVSGKKRSLTESTITHQSRNSDESLGLAEHRRTANSVSGDGDMLSSILAGRESSGFNVQSMLLSGVEPVKRVRVEARILPTKRKALLDDSVILQSDMIRRQLISTEDIRRVRRKAPCTCSEIWMLQKISMEDEVFSEPLSTGISDELTMLHGGIYSSGIKVSDRDGNTILIDCINVDGKEESIDHNRNTVLNLEDPPITVDVPPSGQFGPLNQASEKDVPLHMDLLVTPDCKLNNKVTDSTMLVGTNGSMSNFTQVREHVGEMREGNQAGEDISKGEFLCSMRENDTTAAGQCMSMGKSNEAAQTKHSECTELVRRDEFLGGMRDSNRTDDSQSTCTKLVPINGLFGEMREGDKLVEANQVTGMEFVPRWESVEEIRESNKLAEDCMGTHKRIASNSEILDTGESNQAAEAREDMCTDLVPRSEFLGIIESNQEADVRKGTCTEFVPRSKCFTEITESKNTSDDRQCCDHTEFVPDGGENNQAANAREGILTVFVASSGISEEMREYKQAPDSIQGSLTEFVANNGVLREVKEMNHEAEPTQCTYQEFVPTSGILPEMMEHNQAPDTRQGSSTGFVRNDGVPVEVNDSKKGPETTQCINQELVPTSGVLGVMGDHIQTGGTRHGSSTEFVPNCVNLSEVKENQATDQEVVPRSNGFLRESKEGNKEAEGRHSIFQELVTSNKVFVEMRLCNQVTDARQESYREFVASSEISGELRESNQASEERQASTESSSFLGDSSSHFSKPIYIEPTCSCNHAEEYSQGCIRESHLLIRPSNNLLENSTQRPDCLCKPESMRTDLPNCVTEDSVVMSKGATALANPCFYERSGFGSTSTPDRRLEILFSLGHEDNMKDMISNNEQHQRFEEPDAVLGSDVLDGKNCSKEFCVSARTASGNATEFPKIDGLDYGSNGNGVPLLEEVDLLENSGWSTRTRAVAKYLQTLFTKEDEHGRLAVPMERLLSGKTSKEASRMFFETLVLKTRDYIDISQEKPWESICITPQTKLTKMSFEE